MPKTTKTDKAVSISLSSDDLWVIVADSSTEDPKYLTVIGGWTQNTQEAILFQSKELAERFHTMGMRDRAQENDIIVTLSSLLTEVE